MCGQPPRLTVVGRQGEPGAQTANPLVDPIRADNPKDWGAVESPLDCSHMRGARSKPQLGPSGALPMRRRECFQDGYGVRSGWWCNPLVVTSIVVGLKLEYAAGDDGNISGSCTFNRRERLDAPGPERQHLADARPHKVLDNHETGDIQSIHQLAKIGG